MGGFLATFQVLASFFYHYMPENVWLEPHTYILDPDQRDPVTGNPLPYSMLPIYRPGDPVTVVPMYLDEVRPGRIIAFNECLRQILHHLGYGLVPFLHRVVAVGADEYGWYAVTKGDSLPANDLCKVREGDLKGIVPLEPKVPR